MWGFAAAHFAVTTLTFTMATLLLLILINSSLCMCHSLFFALLFLRKLFPMLLFQCGQVWFTPSCCGSSW